MTDERPSQSSQAASNATTEVDIANEKATEKATEKSPATPLQCLNGSAVAAALAWVAYSITQKVGANFAAHPFESTNYIAVNISVAVRTLIAGLFAMATAVFALTALGIFGLGIQTLLKQRNGDASAS